MTQWLEGFALALVLEGLLPLIFPKIWRDVVTKIAKMTDGQIRFLGLCTAFSGVLTWVFISEFRGI